MKRRLAYLLRGWADRLDPPQAEPVGYSTTTVQAYATSAGWSWNGTTTSATTPDPPRLRVVR